MSNPGLVIVCVPQPHFLTDRTIRVQGGYDPAGLRNNTEWGARRITASISRYIRTVNRYLTVKKHLRLGQLMRLRYEIVTVRS